MASLRENTVLKQDFHEMLLQAKWEIERFDNPFITAVQKPLRMRFRQYVRNKVSQCKTVLPLLNESIIISSKSKDSEF